MLMMSKTNDAISASCRLPVTEVWLQAADHVAMSSHRDPRYDAISPDAASGNDIGIESGAQLP